MMVLGDCSGCETCGSQTCDVIAFLFGQGAEPMPAINYTAFNEGATPTLTVARLPDVFGYHGTPADYETNEGNPPPLVSGDYFYNYDDRTFWYNNGGTWETSPGPTSYGTGEVVVSYAITRPECGCPHMWTADTGTLTWADGDIADKTITLTALAHAGTVPFWTCAGNPYYGESATCELTLVSDAPGRCTNIGYDATLAAVCTHTVTNSGWGTATPYQIRIWSALDWKAVGREDYNGDTDPTYLREDASYDYDDPGTADGSGWREYFPHFGGTKELHFTTDTVSESTLFRAVNTGATSATERTFHDGSGQLTSELSVDGAIVPFSPAAALTLLAEAKAASADGGEGYAWSEPVQEWTWKIRANNGNYDFSDPGFDSSKTYAFTGLDLPAQPFDPADWTEVADTGFAFEYVATTAQTKDFDNAPTEDPGIAYLSKHAFGLGGYRARCATIDASHSASGSPYPYQVEVRFKTYEDFVLVDTSAYIDITDTVYDVDAPTTLGGATLFKYIESEFRLTPLAGVGCSPTGSPTFVCHPGLSC